MSNGETAQSSQSWWARPLLLGTPRIMIAHSRVARLRQSIEAGELVSDRDFDALYPPYVRALSPNFWTPVRVAQRAAKLLAPGPGRRVLDVGSGVGKFCIVAASMAGVAVTGIEHRRYLVRVARDAALRIDAAARFIHGDLSAVEWRSFDAFYFFNPFYENLRGQGELIDDSVELSQQRFLSDVQIVLDALVHAPEGTRVVTYHGLGAELPPAYRLESSECAGSDALQLWIKATRPAARRVVPLVRSESANATI
jgi:SAM-dependent methyltransferase